MPRVRILQGVSGLDFAWAPGDVIDMDDDEAERWADGERAVLADDQEETPAAAAELEHLLPAVVGEDGQDLEVVAAAIEETDPPPGQEDDDKRWVRWSVTVRLPVPAPSAEGDGDPYDPGQHTVKDVLAYLEDATEEEAMRVLQVEESADNPRRGIVGQREDVLARARAGDQARAEKAAEASRGGGRGDAVETR
ncbi:hypothetical protein ACH3XX_00660 [Streptomyces scabiei]|uniref:hypothetical protein n=1 Tax=Streptomyces scabiei TaxID=1930 RepID=UPI0037AFE566